MNTASKFPIPFTDYNFVFGVEGELFAVGATGQMENGRFKIGASAIVGGNLVFGIDKKECVD